MRITTKSSTMVKPMAETPRGNLWLSNLDLLQPLSHHARVVHFYRFDGTANFFDPAVLKAALGRVLVEFYPYAGRLTWDGNNRFEINCNGDGSLFVEAECDGALDDLGDFRPQPGLALAPAVDYSHGISTFPLMLVQLTRFKCGGVCLATASEHHLVDGVCFLQFINTWANISGGSTTMAPPFLDRAVLSARSPPQPKFTHIEFQPPPPLKTPLHTSETSFSMLKLTRDQINFLKAKCNEKGSNYSAFEVVSGHVWRCMCVARGLDKDQEMKMHIPVEGRQRFQPPLPLNYLGNVIFSASPVGLCGEIVSNPLEFAVGRIHEAIARLDNEYMRSCIDYLELKGDVVAIARGTHTTRCPNLGITSWVKLPFYDSNFGWGKPIFVGPGIAPSEGKGFLLRSPTNDGSLLFAVTMLKEHMDLFEKLFYDTLQQNRIWESKL